MPSPIHLERSTANLALPTLAEDRAHMNCPARIIVLILAVYANLPATAAALLDVILLVCFAHIGSLLLT